MHYLAMWQGIRGEDLNIDTAAHQELRCTKTNILVQFTLDTKLLLAVQP